MTGSVRRSPLKPGRRVDFGDPPWIELPGGSAKLPEALAWACGVHHEIPRREAAYSVPLDSGCPTSNCHDVVCLLVRSLAAVPKVLA